MSNEKPRRWFQFSSLSTYLAANPEAQLAWIGFRIFKWLLALILLFSGLLVAYAYMTFPLDIESINELLGDDAAPEDVIAAWRSARERWVSDIKDLGQLFLLTPVFPLLGAVIGYIFGRTAKEPEPGRDPNKRGT
jgi:hypothetical protein